MNLNIDDLKAALPLLSPVISRRKQHPAFGSIRAASLGQGVTLTANNLDQIVSYTCPSGEGEKGEVILVPLTTLATVAKVGKPGTPIHIAEGRVSYRAAAGAEMRADFQAVPADEFPQGPEQGCTLYEAPQGFVAALLRSLPYQSDDEARFVLKSSLVEVANDECRVVAVNGRALFASAPMTTMLPPGEYVVPAFKGMAAFLGEDEGKAEIGLGQPTAEGKPSYLLLRLGKASLTTILVGSKYPDYRQVIPKENDLARFQVGDSVLPALVSSLRAMSAGTKKGEKHILLGASKAHGVYLCTRKHVGVRTQNCRTHVDLLGTVESDLLLPILAQGFRDIRWNPASSVFLLMNDAKETAVLQALRAKQIDTPTDKQIAAFSLLDASTDQPAPAAKAPKPAAPAPKAASKARSAAPARKPSPAKAKGKGKASAPKPTDPVALFFARLQFRQGVHQTNSGKSKLVHRASIPDDMKDVYRQHKDALRAEFQKRDLSLDGWDVVAWKGIGQN